MVLMVSQEAEGSQDQLESKESVVSQEALVCQENPENEDTKE